MEGGGLCLILLRLIIKKCHYHSSSFYAIDCLSWVSLLNRNHIIWWVLESVGVFIFVMLETAYKLSFSKFITGQKMG